MLALPACLSKISLISRNELEQSCLKISAVLKAKIHWNVFAIHNFGNHKQTFAFFDVQGSVQEFIVNFPRLFNNFKGFAAIASKPQP